MLAEEEIKVCDINSFNFLCSFLRPKITTETKDFTRFKINIYFAEQKINTSLTIDPDFSWFLSEDIFFGYFLVIFLQVPRLFSLFVPNQYYFYFKHDSCSAFMKMRRNVFMTFGNFISFLFYHLFMNLSFD